MSETEEFIHCPGCDAAPCKCWALQAKNKPMNQERLLELELDNKRLREALDKSRAAANTPGLNVHDLLKYISDESHKALTHPTPSTSNILKLAQKTHRYCEWFNTCSDSPKFGRVTRELRASMFAAYASLSEEEINLLEGLE
jgi:hypothetical protein